MSSSVNSAADDLIVIPGHDDETGNTNSCLWRSFGKNVCLAYTPGDDFVGFPQDATGRIVVVHSCGYWAYLAARTAGLLENARGLIVIDGWYPVHRTERKWGAMLVDASCVPNIPTVFFFPTVGDRSAFPLEAVVQQSLVRRVDNVNVNVNVKNIVRGLGFGHNLMFEKFQEPQVRWLVKHLCGVLAGEVSETDLVRREEVSANAA